MSHTQEARRKPVRRWAAITGTLIVGVLAGTLAGPQASFAGLTQSSSTAASATQTTPTKVVQVRNVKGAVMATVTFTYRDYAIYVTAEAYPGYQYPGFHGFHLHANDNPANGSGCNTTSPAFTAVDGHYVGSGASHGTHEGDFPPFFADAHGGGTLMFRPSTWLTWDELAGKAVIFHAGRDNLNNVPTGSSPELYTPNSNAATLSTANTGDAGARVGCGIVP